MIGCVGRTHGDLVRPDPSNVTEAVTLPIVTHS